MFDKDFFELFNLTPNFFIDEKLLFKNYTELQKAFHPDKQINKSSSERIIALELSSKLNKSYEVLKSPKSRAEYLLFLKDIIVNQEHGNNVEAPFELLEEIMEINENPSSYNINGMKEACLKNFPQFYEQQKYKEAAQELIKLQYLSKIKEE